jgi:hypothetical protein
MVLVVAAEAPAAAAGSGANCSNASTPHTALTDLKDDRYHGYKGGLYPHGSNLMPTWYRRIGIHRAHHVRPLKKNGQPGAKGRIVLLSVGMSNALLEWGAFTGEAEDLADLAPKLSIVQGAEAGWAADAVADPDAAYWSDIDTTLGQAGLSPKQVQVVWLKEAMGEDQRTFPADARHLRNLLEDIVAILKDRFRNLQIVYVSSRTYGGYATTNLSPEPVAYDTGFAVKWLIADDIRTPRHERPWIAWGPYLWTNGTEGRHDGLIWICDDVSQEDGTHVSESGQAKVADLLMEHFTTKVTARHWFL